jgi:hypothetical protein
MTDTSNGLSPEQIEELKRRKAERAQRAAGLIDQRNAVLETDSPDDAAYDLKKSQELGIPREAIGGARDEYKNDDMLAGMEKMRTEAPKTSAWIAQPDNYAVTKDEADLWGSVEKEFGNFRKDIDTAAAYLKRSADNLKPEDMYFAPAVDMAKGAVRNPRKAATEVGDMGRSLASAAPMSIGSISSGLGTFLESAITTYDKNIISNIPVVNRGVAEAKAWEARFMARNPEFARAVAPYAGPSQILKTYGAQGKAIQKAWEPETMGFEDKVAQGLGQLVVQIGMAMATGGSSAGLTASAAQAQAATSAGISTTMFMAMGVDQQAEMMRAAGVDPNDKLLELSAGGAITGSLEMLRLERVMKILPPEVRNRVARSVVGRVAGQAFEEGIQEGVENVLQNFIATSYDPNATILGGVGEAALVGGTVGGVFQAIIELAMPGKSRAPSAQEIDNILKDVANTQPSAGDKLISGVMEKFAKANLGKRSPEKAADLVSKIVEGTGAETVVIDLDGLAQSLTTAGMDVREALTQLGVDPDAIGELGQLMGTAEIPMGRLAMPSAQLLSAQIIPHMRLATEDVTPFQKTELEGIAELAKRYATDVKEDVARDASKLGAFMDVQEQIYTAMKGSGLNLTEEQYRHNANIAATKFAYMAMRRGQDVRETWAELGPKIMGRDGAQPQTQGSAALESAKVAGYQGEDRGEAESWLRAVEKGLDMSTEGRMARADEQLGAGPTLYHWTESPEDNLYPFTHVGTSKAARDRFVNPANGQRSAGELAERRKNPPAEGATYPVRINLKNVLDIGEDTGSHNPVALASSIAKATGDERLVQEVYEAVINRVDESDLLQIGKETGLDWLLNEDEFGLDRDPQIIAEAILQEYEEGAVDYMPTIERVLLSEESRDGRFALDAGFDVIASYLKDEGITALSYENAVEDAGSVSYIVPNPSNIRSVNAAFDPDQADSADLLAQSIRQAARMPMEEVNEWVKTNVVSNFQSFQNGDESAVMTWNLTEDPDSPQVMMSIRLKERASNERGQTGRADVHLFLDNKMADAMDNVEDVSERRRLASDMFAQAILVMRQYESETPNVKAFNFIAAENRATKAKKKATNSDEDTSKSREQLYRSMLSTLKMDGYTAYEVTAQMSVVREEDGAKTADPLFTPGSKFVLIKDGVDPNEFVRTEILRGSQRGQDAGEVVTALKAVPLTRSARGGVDGGGRDAGRPDPGRDGQQGAEGLTQPRRGGYDPKTREMSFTGISDASTFLHENSHWFLATLEELAPTEKWAADDLAEINSWYQSVRETPKMQQIRARYSVVPDPAGGVRIMYQPPADMAGETPAAMRLERVASMEEAEARIEWRERQEAWAETTEEYFMTGEAPVPRLKQILRDFKNWLVQVYRGMLPGERANLTPEIRSMMDRILAVDVEVEAASAEVFRDARKMADEMLGKGIITPRQHKLVGDRLDKAREEVKEELLARVMQEKLEAGQASRAMERTLIKGDIARAFDKSPVGRAFNWLAFGEWKGDLPNEPGTMSPEAADARSNEEVFQLGRFEMPGSPEYESAVRKFGKDGMVWQMPDGSDGPRKARARAMGYDVDNPLYHGTTQDFEEFQGLTFLTSSQYEASAYGNLGFKTRAELDEYQAKAESRQFDGDELAGQQLPYSGIISDIPPAERVGTWATDQGVVTFEGDTFKIANKVTPDYGTGVEAADGSMQITVRSLRDGEAAPGKQYFDDRVGSMQVRADKLKEQGVGTNNQVIPVYAKGGKFVELDPFEANILGKRLQGNLSFDMQKRLDDLLAKIEGWKAEGYVGIKTVSDEGRALGDDIPQLVIFDPSNIRSVNAAFDPDNLESAVLLGQDPVNPAAPRPPTASDLIMRATRGERERAVEGEYAPGEKKKIAAQAKKHKVPLEMVEKAIEDRKRDHPRTAGWGPLTFKRIAKVTKTRGRPPKIDYEYEQIPYGFNKSPDGKNLKPGSQAYKDRTRAMAALMYEEVFAVFRRAQNGDENAKNIIAQAGWYRAMRARLRAEFGGVGDLFADLLGATSPNTPVRENWNNAIDVLRRAMRGDFDDQIEQWEAWVEETDTLERELQSWVNQQKLVPGATVASIKRMPEYETLRTALFDARKRISDILPHKEAKEDGSAAKYGINGKNVIKATVDLWRVVRNANTDLNIGGTRPKAINFSGNLIGFKTGATIDVWAARLLQRIAGMMRIPSAAESTVTGYMLEDGTTTLQFGFGQEVFKEAVALIRGDETLSENKVFAEINDDDLQAVVWFIEKELWTANGWTSKEGEGGSFEFEANLTGVADQERVTALRKIVNAGASTPEQKAEAIAEIESLERVPDRFIAGLSIQQSSDLQGRPFVPVDADMAALSNRLRLAIYEADDGNTVLVGKAVSTEGRYGDVERSIDLEVVTREGYDTAPLWRQILTEAQNANQDSAFMAKVLQGDDYDPLKHRPGFEIYFQSAKSGAELDVVLRELADNGVEFYTIITDGRRSGAAKSGAMPPAVGVRVLYLPEFDQRYGNADLLAMDDAALAEMVEAKKEEMVNLADDIMSKVDAVSFASQFWYDARVAFSSEYQEQIDGKPTGIIEEKPSSDRGRAWAGRPLAEALAGADRHVRETSRGEPDEQSGDSLGQGPANESLSQPKAPIFYSALSRFIENSKTAKAPASQWKGMITNAPGIKVEEVEMSGVMEWLDLQEGPVTREAVAAFVAANGVTVEEVKYSSSLADNPRLDAIQREMLPLLEENDRLMGEINDLGYSPEADALREAFNRNVELINDLRAERFQIVNSDVDSTKWSSWTLPGGENYTELLLTVPGVDYKDSHFPGVKGTIAHVRLKERIGPNGERVLALEEVQSGIHQAGRERGYKGSEPLNFEGWYAGNGIELFGMPFEIMPAKSQEMARLRYDRYRAEFGNTAVPNAPFKNNAWVELVLKRMVRYAAENGFDSVAWIPGNIQNGREVEADDNRSDFYDKILPNIANKFGKKYGARVESVLFEDAYIDKDYEVVGNEDDGYQVEDTATGRLVPKAFAYEEEAMAWIGKQESGTTFHSLPITPQLREAALNEGFPLFQPRKFNPPGHGAIAPPTDIPPVRLDLKLVKDLYGEEAVRKLPAAVRRRSSTSSNVTDIIQQIEAVRKVLSVKRKGPQTLTQFIMQRSVKQQDGSKRNRQWGIKGADGELRAMGLERLINNKSGMPIDAMRELAEEAGFIRAETGGARNTEYGDLDATPNDLLDALAREAKGEPVVRIGEEVDNKELDDAKAWASWLEQNGVDIYETDQRKLRASVDQMLRDSDESLVSPDKAAEMFGFANGEELLKALSEVGNRDAFLNKLADQKMVEEFGDMMTDGTLQAEAAEAARLDIAHRQNEIEMEALARALGQQASANYAKSLAKDIIAMRTVKEIAAYERDLNNERQFGKQALRLVEKGDYPAALKAKQRQLVSMQLYTEGKKAHERIEKQRQDLLKYYTSEGRRDKIAGDYLEKIEDILERFELRVSKQGPSVQRERMSAAKYVAEMDAAGRQDEVAPEARLLAELNEKMTWRNMTSAEVEHLVGTIQNLGHLGRTKDSLLKAQEKRKFRAVIDSLVDRMNLTGKLPGVTRERSPTKTTTETLVDALREGHSWLMRPEHQARSLDGGELGPVWEAIFRPISEAGDVESRMMREATQLYREAWDKFTGAERNAMSKRSISVPELPGIGKRFTKLDLISVALNWGVTYNREVLMEGYGWQADQVEAALFRVLTDKDWDLVESIWEISGMYKAEAFQVEKDMTGVTPKSVEGISFTLPSGRKIDGKYYHIQYDASQPGKMSRRQAKDNDAEALSAHRKSRTKAMTKNGGLIERKGSGGRKVKLGLSVFEKALSETIHDIAFRRAVYDVGRIVADDQFADTYQEVAGMEAYRQLNVWLKDVAMPPMEVLDPIVKAFAHVRRNVPLAVMGYKVGTALIQPTGLLAAMPLVGHRRVLVAVAQSFANPDRSMYGAWKKAASMSEFMRDRVAGYERDVRETTTAMTKGGAADIMRRNAFTFITGMDIAVSVPTWMAAYGKAMDGKVQGIAAGDQDDAVAYADSIIRRTQTAGKTQDLSRFQRGGEFQKQISMIFGYFNNLYSLTAQQTLDMRRGNLSKAQYAWHMTVLFVAIPLFAELLAGRLIPDDDDEDEATIEGNIATTLISNFSGMFPGIRDAVSLNLKPEFGYRMSPTAKFMEDIGKTLGLPAQLLLDEERELTEADVKRAVNTAGALTGLPSAQINITGDYIVDLLEGEEDPAADPLDAASEALVRNTR